MIRSWILVFFLFFGIEGNLFSQRYFTRSYSEADGLPSNMVFDITQDTSGLLWFATRYGISSYDGVNWTHYNPSANQISPSFAFIMTDERGKLWAVPLQSEPTAFWFSGEEWHKFDCKTGKTHPVIISAFDVFYQDDVPILALGTQKDGIFVSRNKQWVHYGEKEGLISNKIRSIVALGDQIFIGTKMGLSVLRGGHVSNELNALLPTGSQEILALALARNSETTAGNQKIYLMGNGWLGTLSDSAFTMITEGFDLAIYKVTSNSFIYPDENNGLFFGNPYDLYYLAPSCADSFERMDRDNGLISDGATSVLIDREKNTWLTSFRGVNKIPSFRFSSFTAIEGLLDNEVASALEYAPGSYIFGHLGGITFYDGKSFETLNFNPSDEMPNYEIRIQDLDYDQKGNIWLSGSKLGIARIDQKRRVKWYRKPEGIKGDMVSVVVIPDGNIYAANGKQIFALSSEDKFIPVSTPKIRNSRIRKLFAGDDTTLYVATINSGILAKRERESILIQSPANLNGNNVFAFLTDSRERRWVGTNDGLYIIAEGDLVQYDSNGLTINRPIYLILEDHLGNLWFGTDNGVIRWNGEKLDHFTKAEGILGQDLNRDAGFMDHQNHIWFGTNSGLTLYKPEYEYEMTEVPAPITTIQWIEVDNDTISPEKRLVLESTQNNVNFHFRAISFINEEKIFYSCFLEGFDKQWSKEFQSPTGSYHYNNLNPGTYTFCVKAKNALGIWSEPVCSSIIKVRSPFWFRGWFIAICIVVLAGISYMAIRFSIIQQYKNRLEKMVSYKTRALQRSEKKLKESNMSKDKFFSIIAHDLKSPFNAILGFLDLLTTEYDEFSDQERQRILKNLKTSAGSTINLLDNLLTWSQSQKGILPFEPEKFNVMELVQENISLVESAAESKQITLIKPDPEIVLVYADRNMINTVIRNLLSNAIKFTSSNGSVEINARKENRNEVIVNVRDSGGGINEKVLKGLFNIENVVSTKGTNNESGTGLGLILSKEFIVKNRGRIGATSDEGKGSTFWFIVPTNHKG
ncbi:MAG: hypothetical protein ISR57_00985 [Bacteroidales bacterium]|nr:hypothetical protein [Bacteroidales bacterium]